MEAKSNKLNDGLTLIFNINDIIGSIQDYLNKQGIDYELITVPGRTGIKYACVKGIRTTDDNKTLKKSRLYQGSMMIFMKQRLMLIKH